jgi:hypothetical protein
VCSLLSRLSTEVDDEMARVLAESMNDTRAMQLDAERMELEQAIQVNDLCFSRSDAFWLLSGCSELMAQCICAGPNLVWAT